jgi:hypothetical protein
MSSNLKDKGFGDTVARFTRSTGIKKLVESMSSDCGCDARQEKLNKMLPYGRSNQKNNNG